MIARTAAIVRRDGLTDGGLVRTRHLSEQLARREQHPRSTESALQRVLGTKGALKVGDLASFAHTLDGLYTTAVGLHGQHQASPHQPAVHADGARPADSVLAPDVRARQAQLVTKKIDEVLPRLDSAANGLAVDVKSDLDAKAHGRLPSSCCLTRCSKTRARCRRRAELP